MSDSFRSRNRSWWNANSDDYQRRHGDGLAREPLAWGVWRIPESQVRALGELDGRDVLELGCGAAQWTLALRKRGVRATGIDLSRAQLGHARMRTRSEAAAVPLVQADAEALPFGDCSFDVVFCDHGATTFAPPGRVVPETARVLRPGGRFVFCISSPIFNLCWDTGEDRVGDRLANDYFGMRAVDDGESVAFQLPYGEWIRLFRRCGFAVEDLVELRAPRAAHTTYTDYVGADWARRWPAENIWMLRRVGDAAASAPGGV